MANKSDNSARENEPKHKFVKLKSEFELLKLCQGNNNTRLFANIIPSTGSTEIKRNNIIRD